MNNQPTQSLRQDFKSLDLSDSLNTLTMVRRAFAFDTTQFIESDERPNFMTHVELFRAIGMELRDCLTRQQVALDPTTGEVSLRMRSVADFFHEVEGVEIHDLVRTYFVEIEGWTSVRMLPKAYMGDSVTVILQSDSLKSVSKNFKQEEATK